MENTIRFMNTKEVAKALGCCIPTARRIMKRPDFPLVRTGKNMRVSEQAFVKWADSRHI